MVPGRVASLGVGAAIQPDHPLAAGFREPAPLFTQLMP
jgi:hypothetical protein